MSITYIARLRTIAISRISYQVRTTGTIGSRMHKLRASWGKSSQTPGQIPGQGKKGNRQAVGVAKRQSPSKKNADTHNGDSGHLKRP